MIKRGKGGHIVNTASISAFFAIPTAPLYTTTKFALRELSESLRIELSKFDIGVSCLCPGSVNTNFLEVGVTRPKKFSQTGFVDDPDYSRRMKRREAEDRKLKRPFSPRGAEPAINRTGCCPCGHFW
jgi:short-subunit dehydrogenase